MTSILEKKCVERGLRMTDQRRIIAQVLSEATDHPDAEEVYTRASLKDPKISLATVYRTVRLFDELDARLTRGRLPCLRFLSLVWVGFIEFSSVFFTNFCIF